MDVWRPPAPAATPHAHAPDTPAFRRRSSGGETGGVRAWAGCGGSSVVINNFVVNLCTFAYSFKCFYNHELNCLIQLSMFGCFLFYSILFYFTYLCHFLCLRHDLIFIFSMFLYILSYHFKAQVVWHFQKDSTPSSFFFEQY